LSQRSDARGSPAAISTRLALRTCSMVATRTANLSRCVLRCRGSRWANSALIPSAQTAIPLTCVTARSHAGNHTRSVHHTQLQPVNPEHLSVYQTSPELWEREAFEEQLDGAPEATGEPGNSSAGELGRLVVRVFFSAGAGLLAWSNMPVETAQ